MSNLGDMTTSVGTILQRARDHLDRAPTTNNNDLDITELSEAIRAVGDLWPLGMSENPALNYEAASTREEWLDVPYGIYNAHVFALEPGEDWSDEDEGLFHFVVGDLNLRLAKSHLLERALHHYEAASRLVPPTEFDLRVLIVARSLQAAAQKAMGPRLFAHLEGRLGWDFGTDVFGRAEEVVAEYAASYADALVLDPSPEILSPPDEDKLHAMAEAFVTGADLLEHSCRHSADAPYRKPAGWLAVASASYLAAESLDLVLDHSDFDRWINQALEVHRGPQARGLNAPSPAPVRSVPAHEDGRSWSEQWVAMSGNNVGYRPVPEVDGEVWCRRG